VRFSLISPLRYHFFLENLYGYLLVEAWLATCLASFSEVIEGFVTIAAATFTEFGACPALVAGEQRQAVRQRRPFLFPAFSDPTPSDRPTALGYLLDVFYDTFGATRARRER
jgi:hypothetical protein